MILLSEEQEINRRHRADHVLFSASFDSLFSKLDPETDQTSWANPVMKNCKRLVAITDLDNITVTNGTRQSVTRVYYVHVSSKLNRNRN